MREVISVLLVEDDEDDYVITRDLLTGQERVGFRIDWCQNAEEAISAIQRNDHDVYLIDYRLGEKTGLDLLRTAISDRIKAPVIMLTSQRDYQIDLEASALGVTDFLIKQDLNPAALERAIRYAINHRQALRELALSEERYALAACATNDGIWDWDLLADEVHYSPRWFALLGLPELGEGREIWFDRVDRDDLPGLRLSIEAHLSGRTSLLQFKHRMHHADGSWRWMLVRGMAVRDTHGKVTRMAGSLSDITMSRLTEEQLRHDAVHDALTGLPNRNLFMDRLTRAMPGRRRDPTAGCAVLFIDVDGFKLVNDTYGHGVGDRLIVALSKRIGAELGLQGTVARIAGDEFTVLLDDLYLDDAAELAQGVAQRIRQAVAQPFVIDSNRLFVTASVGIAVPNAQTAPEDVVRNADIAMYESKHLGRGRSLLYDESMHRRVSSRLNHQNELRDVVERSLLEVHYQPVIDLASGDIHGFEALARWPAGRLPLSPVQFIPLAEETGLIEKLGLDVLRLALRSIAAWRKAGLVKAHASMSVNVSAQQLDDPNFPDLVLGALAESDLPGEALVLEITEGTLMREPERMDRIMSEVCAAGVRLELDDFGTGYSSLAALHHFSLNALKIDRTFVAALTETGDGEPIVRSTVALGHSLGLDITAEGIETPDQLDRLRELGCDRGQGFLLSRPQPPHQISELLQVWTPMRFADRATDEAGLPVPLSAEARVG